MIDPRTAPYGTWSSPIGADLLATAGVDLMEPWLEDGVVHWLEARPAEGGRHVVVRGDAWSAPTDVTPPGFNARTTVHEYGGASYLVHRGTVYFSNFEDQRIYRQAEGGLPEPITPATDRRHRYADGRVTPDGSLLLCVRERHEDDGVVNELVAVPLDGGDIRTIVHGRDFYSAPRISPDGARLAWLSWDLPWMPWDGCELWVADLAPDGAVSSARRVAGADGEEAIVQPEWDPSGSLHFVSDRSGWWNLYRDEDGTPAPLYPAEMEFAGPLWLFGASNFAFLDDGRIACQYEHEGVAHLGILDPVSGELLDLDLPDTAFDYPWLRAEGSQLVFVGGAPSIPMEVVWVDLASRGVEVLRESLTLDLDASWFSSPRTIEFPTDGGLTAFAHFYPPLNPGFVAPRGERPPLIVMSHGGPTSESSSEFNLRTQFFTSRGFAVVDVNYGGSTGYGRAYRQRLNGNWGVVDTMDCINAATYLVERGEADGDRLLIRGGSAGGYTTLCALTFHDVFAAGASYYGISDLEPFAMGDTHKFESRYEHTLVGPFPEAIDVYRARSPIQFVDMISCPMILLQGDEDEVVPPSQSEVMVEALAAKGIPHAYLLFEGEQHGFRKAETIRRAAEAELSFYAQILGFELGDPVEPVSIVRP
jgi:dipeptidyl aminopeptidase/acylaminoacyl peptidase